MRKCTLFILVIICFAHVLLAESIFKKGDVYAVCGDSITQQGIYSVFIEDYILMCQPVEGIQIIQCGWGGTTAPHFADHMKDTALTFSPTVATTYYGMNDGGYNNYSEEMGKMYRDGLTKVVKNFKGKGVRTIIIGSAGGVDVAAFRNPKVKDVTAADYNKTLGKLADIGREVAKSEGVLFADIHTPLMETMTKAKAALGEKYNMGGGDGVHASPNGHIVFAYAFLKAMGFDGNIGTITYDAASGKGMATESHKVVSSKVGEITIESTRYPYCFAGGSNNHPTGPTASVLPFLPFNEELNRYLLVVKNLKSPKAKITWGTESKEFTAEQLGKGVNLAAEFLDNPFVPAFTEVSRLIAEKQKFNITFIKDLCGDRFPSILQIAPEKAAALDSVNASLREVNASLIEKCAKAIKPVTHTIKIEEVK